MKNLHRRQVLRGAGGFTLGLPFLPSLASRAFAADPAPARRPRFVAFTTEHGGVDGKNMYPDPATLTQKQELFTGHTISYGPLVRRVQGSDAVVSPVLTAPASVLTDRLVGKMNVLRGLDIPFYIGHHTGGHLGNYARNDGNGSDGKSVQMSPRPTIDQVLAWSPRFYGDLAGVKERSIYGGSRDRLSYGWSNPQAGSGTIQALRAEPSSLALFNRIFVPPAMSSGAPARQPIVDRVLDSYRQLRSGSRRLSALDRQRLDDHLSRLAELQRRLHVTTSASCGSVMKPADDTDRVGYAYSDPVKARRRAQLYNDVIVAAFMCGTTRIAVHGIGETFAAFAGDWHQDIAHKCTMAGPQQILADALRATFQGAMLDLAAKLDVEEAGGATYLDNTLIAWSQESGQHTHDSPSLPLVTFGGAAGFFKTGLFVDYRNQTPKGRLSFFGSDGGEWAGLTFNRWLGTVLQAMGLAPADYERDGVPGYGLPFISPDYTKAYGPGVVGSARQPLPVIT